jgi:hypothetical protein
MPITSQQHYLAHRGDRTSGLDGRHAVQLQGSSLGMQASGHGAFSEEIFTHILALCSIFGSRARADGGVLTQGSTVLA